MACLLTYDYPTYSGVMTCTATTTNAPSVLRVHVRVPHSFLAMRRDLFHAENARIARNILRALVR